MNINNIIREILVTALVSTLEVSTRLLVSHLPGVQDESSQQIPHPGFVRKGRKHSILAFGISLVYSLHSLQTSQNFLIWKIFPKSFSICVIFATIFWSKEWREMKWKYGGCLKFLSSENLEESTIFLNNFWYDITERSYRLALIITISHTKKKC